MMKIEQEMDWLEQIIADDPDGLSKMRPKVSVPTADSLLLSRFQEINDFYAFYAREPAMNMGNITEFSLASRLKNIRSNTEQCLALQEVDVYKLLNLD